MHPNRPESSAFKLIFFFCSAECIQAIRIVLDFQGIQEKTGKHPLFIAENAAGPKPWFIPPFLWIEVEAP